MLAKTIYERKLRKISGKEEYYFCSFYKNDFTIKESANVEKI
jgi:hypothetical protein